VLARTDPNEQESVVLLDEHGRPLAGARGPGGTPATPDAA
jgi:hypothetical protein